MRQMKSLKIRKKRHLTLLEVLIALLLVIMVLPVLVSSFLATYTQQEKFTDEIFLNRLANNAFVSVFEDMSKNRISYQDLESEREFSLNSGQFLADKRNWEGSYSFKKLRPDKPPKNTAYFVELWQLHFTFSQDNKKKANTFDYDFIVVRDLATVPVPAQEATTK